MSNKRYLNDEVELWKEKRYYEKVIIDYYSTNEIYPDVANRIVDGLTKFMNIAEQQQQEIEHLREDLASWEAGLNQTKEMYELQRQLRQTQGKVEQYEKVLNHWNTYFDFSQPVPKDLNELGTQKGVQRCFDIARQALEVEK
ncbi:hypothetical protein NST12_16665 [Bacillus sp. FSL W8-1127]|uniref:hypothetical protein n=1 Tax=Bacillus sp. FSL W8-1127 TaxID=2954710 RepID=UPI0030FA80CC